MITGSGQSLAAFGPVYDAGQNLELELKFVNLLSPSNGVFDDKLWDLGCQRLNQTSNLSSSLESWTSESAFYRDWALWMPFDLASAHYQVSARTSHAIV